jgi:ribonuclease P protein component
MLPAAHRMRRREDFTLAVRRGRRAGCPHLVVHLWVDPDVPNRPDHSSAYPPVEPAREPTRVGFVVSKAVGGAVVRTRVKRRLRAQVADRLRSLPAGSLVVVRAQPPAAAAASADLAAALDRTLRRLLPAASR